MLKKTIKAMANVATFVLWFILGIWSIMLMFTGNGIIDTTIKFIPFLIWITGMAYNTLFRKVEKEDTEDQKEQA